VNTISSNKLIADYMGVGYGRYECECCGRLDPEVFPVGNRRFTKCCTTRAIGKDVGGNWIFEDPKNVFYEFDYQGDRYATKYKRILTRRTPENLRYHSSWDELMPVVQKIKDTGCQVRPEYQRIFNILVKADLLELYDVVVDFILAYNIAEGLYIGL
jgi:hypothetical protein